MTKTKPPSRIEAILQHFQSDWNQFKDAYECEQEIPGQLLEQLCEGHFKNNPITPGAYLVALSVKLARGLGWFATSSSFIVNKAIFRSALLPHHHNIMRATRRPESNRIRVEFLTTHDHGHIARIELEPSDHRPLALLPEAIEDRGACINASQARACLAHEPPALLIADQRAAWSQGAEFATVEGRGWHWSEALDAAAQAAGLWAHQRGGTAGQPVYVAAFERLGVAAVPPVTRPLVRLRFLRTVMQLRQFEFTVLQAAAGGPWLGGRLALAAHLRQR